MTKSRIATTLPLRGLWPLRAAQVLAAAAALLLASSAGAAEPKKSPELLAKGKASYDTNCSACHGEKGLGDGEAGAGLDPKPRNLVKDKFKKGTKPAEIHAMLGKGIEGTSMVAFSQLPDDELWGLTYYVLELRGGKKK